LIIVLEDIGGCRYMLRLEVTHNPLTDFGGSTFCYSLTYLNLSHNQIKVIPKTINLLSNIVTLNISYNKIESLSSLKACKSLKSLIATGNQIKSVKDVKSLTELQTLILSKNVIESIDGIESMECLQKLSVSGNMLRIVNIGTMPMLGELRLNGNKIIKVELKTYKLKLLDVGNNPIVKKSELLSSLSELKRLENLNVKYWFKGKNQIY
jgi:Leucine-rich repeat (LRR) protein